MVIGFSGNHYGLDSIIKLTYVYARFNFQNTNEAPISHGYAREQYMSILSQN